MSHNLRLAAASAFCLGKTKIPFCGFIVNSLKESPRLPRFMMFSPLMIKCRTSRVLTITYTTVNILNTLHQNSFFSPKLCHFHSISLHFPDFMNSRPTHMRRCQTCILLFKYFIIVTTPAHYSGYLYFWRGCNRRFNLPHLYLIQILESLH